MNIGIALFITSIVLTVPALAQGPVTVHKIEIELTGPDCKRASQVFLIAAGEDVLHSAERETPNGCRWTYENGGFQVNGTPFSLRLRGARTPCRYAILASDRVDKHKKIGKLEFRYEENDADDLTITTVPPTFDLTYSRKLPADKRKRNVECDERYSSEKPGMVELNDVWLSAETLDLEIAWTDKPAGAKWVRLDRHRDKIKANVKKRLTKLTPDDLGSADVERTLQENGDIASNQGDKVAEVFRKKGLKSVQVKAE